MLQLEFILVLEILDHVRSIQLVPQPSIVIPRADTRNHCQSPTAMLFTCDPLGFFHKQRTDALVLEYLGITAVYTHGSSVNMLKGTQRSASSPDARFPTTTHQLSYQTTSSRHARQFLSKSTVLGTLAQSQQADQNIQLGILVREESLPSSVSSVVAAQQLDRSRSHTAVNLGHLETMDAISGKP